MAEGEATSRGPLSFLTNIPAIKQHADLFLAFGVLGILTVMLFPMPVWLLDMMLSLSIMLSVLIMMNVLLIEKSLDFNSFPTVLLIAAMLRLSLNIATTRTILSHGHEGPGAAGNVIETFGSLVAGNSVVIGAIIFLILTLINFIVITKGSGRIAEVSARFSLDAMPGKQMAIDADLSAGLINEAEAKSRRKELESESTFFGAMDGASKFVRGDAIAGIIITFINFIAGIVIGVVQKDMEFSLAVETYTRLTIGDGLVSQIPSLIVSTSAGLLVTKSGVSGSAEKAIFGQLGRYPKAMMTVSLISLILALTPGLPTLPFVVLMLITGFGSWYLFRNPVLSDEEVEFKQAEMREAEEAEAQKDSDEPINQTLAIDTIRLELGYGLLPLINYSKGQKLTEQIKSLRKQMAKDLGFVIPSVRIQDNMQLPANTYAIKVKEIECARGDIRPDLFLAMDPTGAKVNLPGEDTVEPTFGLPAKWINESSREEALFKSYTVVPPPTVITTHLTEVIKENISELLSYSETQKLLDSAGEEHQKLINDLVPGQVNVGVVQRVLQSLLNEVVSIRDLPTIIEAISEAVKVTKSVLLITEHVRSRLARQISYAFANQENQLPVVNLSQRWEQTFSESLAGGGEEKQLAMAPSQLQAFMKESKEVLERFAMQGDMPVLITSPANRPYVRAIIERVRSQTPVISHNEIYPKIQLKTLGQL